jgi:hypothetical protein
MTDSTSGPQSSSRLQNAITELHAMQALLLGGDLDSNILTDFRDAVNRVRNSAWTAQQYMACKETERDSTSLLSLVAGERIRTTYQLCQAIGADLERTDIQFQAGSLVQLCEVMKALTAQLDGVINKLG